MPGIFYQSTCRYVIILLPLDICCFYMGMHDLLFCTTPCSDHHYTIIFNYGSPRSFIALTSILNCSQSPQELCVVPKPCQYLHCVIFSLVKRNWLNVANTRLFNRNSNAFHLRWHCHPYAILLHPAILCARYLAYASNASAIFSACDASQC